MPRFLALLIALTLAAAARADVTYPTKPADRGDKGFISDEAKLVHDDDAKAIRERAEKLLTDKRIPIIVCTLTSMADHGAAGWTIERYAHNLFDEWGVGAKEYSYGILVLVSQGDRKARIELGSGWNRERDNACQTIMNVDMVPRFKQGDYSKGILEGVKSLDTLARGNAPPAPGMTTPAAPAATPSAPAPRPASTPVYSRPAPSYTPSYSSHSSGVGGLGLSAIVCLAGPLVGFFIIIALVRRAFGGVGRGWGGGYFPGGYGGYGGGWGPG